MPSLHVRCLLLPYGSLAPSSYRFHFLTHTAAPTLSLALKILQYLTEYWWSLRLHPWYVHITCLRRKPKVNSLVAFQKIIISVELSSSIFLPHIRGPFFNTVLKVHQRSLFMNCLLLLSHSSFLYFNSQLPWVQLKQQVWVQRPMLISIALPGLPVGKTLGDSYISCCLRVQSNWLFQSCEVPGFWSLQVSKPVDTWAVRSSLM